MKIRLILGLILLAMTFSISGVSCAFSKPVLTKNGTSEPANLTDVQKSEDEKSKPTNLKYAEMNEDEKLRFIEAKSNEFLSLFPKKNNDNIDSDGVTAVKQHVDSYFKRTLAQKSTSSGCRFGDNLADVLQRGKGFAPDLSSAFVNKGLPAQLGIYIPMIEAEFCPCLQAPTGALGMFQLTAAAGSNYGLKTIKGASPKKPDDRCNAKLSADAAATYLKRLLDVDFGNNSIGAPFAISSYNAGEGNIKTLIRAINESKSTDFNYWTLRKSVLGPAQSNNASKLSFAQFINENSKYFPKFLAARIVGENPKTFGIEMEPLSQTK